ncbi:MAG: hypothetical protein A2Z27_01120 [candidate division Zixibacteria bacterium RBG_16_50_21]|nr:MAG: hypothetical protein A2Z27_01120 [candidate division Zixibacteria bacterium RBG_16_50_21]
MQIRQIKNIYLKEMLDTLKDRRTLISMIIIPILIFPLLMFGLGSLVSSQVKKAQAREKTIAIYGEEFGPELTKRIFSQEGLVRVDIKRDSLAEFLHAKVIQAAVEFSPDFESRLSRGDTAGVEICYDETEVKSKFALGQIEQVIRQYEAELVEAKLKAVSLSKESISPIRVTPKNLASPEKMGGFFLAMFLPYMLMILCMTGAMYPAMDLTAGEKERGTLETLLVTPASRLDIASGKFLAVLTASFVTGVLGTASMTASSLMGFMTFDEASVETVSATLSISPLSIILVLVLIIPIACLFSSLLLALALMARSYKEAQSYISPLMIVVIFPAFASLMPGFEFQTSHTFIPIMNTSLVLKDVLLGTFEWERIGLVFLVNTVYAAVGIYLAKRMFEKESVLFRI